MFKNFTRGFPFNRRVRKREFFSGSIPTNSNVLIRYLGTAGFVIDSDNRTLVIDPYVSRPSLLSHAFPLKPNERLIRQEIPFADDVLIGHAHSDHVLDAPLLCQQTGARFIGSKSACMVARAFGLPETQIRETIGNETITSGLAKLRAIPSKHGQTRFGIPFPGDIKSKPSWPPRVNELRHGLVLNWHIEIGGVSIVHIDSADFISKNLKGVKADVLCLCAVGRQFRPNYTKEAIGLLKPKFVIPCHWDNFFRAYHRPPKLMFGVDLKGFVAEILRYGAEPVLLPFNGKFGFKK